MPCYRTDPSRIHMGWVSKKIVKSGKTAHLWGCFYAEKLKKLPERSYVLDHSAKVQVPLMDLASSGRLWRSRTYSQFTDLSPFRFLQLRKGSIFKSIHHSLRTRDTRAPASRFMQIGIDDSNIYACPGITVDSINSRHLTLPKKWSWLDDLKDIPQNIQPFSQGECGSCYAMASLYVLAMRFYIVLNKLYPDFNLDNVDLALSVQSIVSCSPYNQGCLGGFPFLVGKHLVEFGAIPEADFPYQSLFHFEKIRLVNSGSQVPKCKRSLEPTDKGWFASNYGYVGGCYECTSEDEIMKEIYHHGPVAVAIDAPNSLFSYSDGWEYTNHAVVLVGWGEEESENGPVKYWIARNTWGNDWGIGGFFKIKRGVNLRGIESQAVYIDPDFSRGMGLEIVNSRRNFKRPVPTH
ncbi:bifunctional Peptidase C1A [Babesia duncani]|uniref:Bifunctional Peptidase C1A n=1 Tax=Babesia duncani TaxID=323732 RepID=A0AAD9UQ98_9APIC|nr:bifunctional Peptidase C1A [Babesia duncani]